MHSMVQVKVVAKGSGDGHPKQHMPQADQHNCCRSGMWTRCTGDGLPHARLSPSSSARQACSRPCRRSFPTPASGASRPSPCCQRAGWLAGCQAWAGRSLRAARLCWPWQLQPQLLGLLRRCHGCGGAAASGCGEARLQAAAALQRQRYGGSGAAAVAKPFPVGAHPGGCCSQNLQQCQAPPPLPLQTVARTAALLLQKQLAACSCPPSHSFVPLPP